MDTRGKPSELQDATGIPNQGRTAETQQVHPELVQVSFATKITMALGRDAYPALPMPVGDTTHPTSRPRSPASRQHNDRSAPCRTTERPPGVTAQPVPVSDLLICCQSRVSHWDDRHITSHGFVWPGAHHSDIIFCCNH